MSPHRYQEEDDEPELRMKFRNFNVGHLLILICGFGGSIGLWVHGDSSKSDLSAKMEANRSALVSELSAKIDEKMQPFEKRLSTVEDWQKNLESLKIQIVKLTQAINDMKRIPEINNSDDAGIRDGPRRTVSVADSKS